VKHDVGSLRLPEKTRRHPPIDSQMGSLVPRARGGLGFTRCLVDCFSLEVAILRRRGSRLQIAAQFSLMSKVLARYGQNKGRGFKKKL
jgi:hypothetical protein